MSILVTGSIAYDIALGYDGSFAEAINTASLDQLSVSFFSPHYQKHHGGTAANIGWGLHLLGVKPTIVGTVGIDGGSYIALLEERGIDTTYIEKRDDAVTATAIMGTDSSERQIAFFHPGADALGTWVDMAELREEISRVIISPRNAVLMMEAVQWCVQYAVPFVFDPGQLIIGLSDDELRFGISHASGLIANAYEWSLLQQRLALTEEHIAKIVPWLVVTEGERGATLYTQNAPVHVPPCIPDRVMNHTGAGDAFRAGLLSGLEWGWSLEDAVRLGCCMGSFAVEIEGSLLDHLDREDIWRRAEQVYGAVLPERTF